MGPAVGPASFRSLSLREPPGPAAQGHLCPTFLKRALQTDVPPWSGPPRERGGCCGLPARAALGDVAAQTGVCGEPDLPGWGVPQGLATSGGCGQRTASPLSGLKGDTFPHLGAL